MSQKDIKASLIRKYTNGYQAHWIDGHPHGKTYRDVHNGLGYAALPDEQIMLLNGSGVVVVFLKSLFDLDKMQKVLKLQEPINRNTIFAND